jgi:hypothetical protein
MLLENADYNNDSIPDTVVTKGGKGYSFNGYLTKDSDFPLRKKFIAEHLEKYDTGRKNKNDEAIMIYPKYKRSSIVNPHFGTNAAHPRYIKWNLNTTFDDATVNQYPSVQKYYCKTNSMSDSTAYSVLTEEIMKPLWTGLKQIAKGNQNLLDLIEEISYITFKNKALDAIIRNDVRLEIYRFDDLKPSKKTKLANDYFDRVTSNNVYGIIQQIFNVLVGMKENILKQAIDQEITNLYFAHIQKLYSH